VTGQDRYDRQVRLFGDDGQRRIADCTVGIVGLGGLGSHVAQQLAYLGTTTYTLVDPDVVDTSNLNRLIGATSSDASSSVPKVVVADRLIRTVQEAAEIQRIEAPIESAEAVDALGSVDVAFGCVDGDAPRLQLTDLCSRARRPYVDIASEVAPDGSWYGGRMVWNDAGTGCLVCRGELDQHVLARAQMSEEQRQADDRIYGVRRGDLGGAGPAVVSVNGVMASLAVTEFMVWVTGLRAPVGFLTYRGDLGSVTRRTDPPSPRCYYCQVLRERGSSLPEP